MYTNERSYLRMNVRHGKVCYKASEYVRAQETESFWSMLRYALKRTLHNNFLPTHLNCYFMETVGKLLRYHDLTANDGLVSGAKS